MEDITDEDYKHAKRIFKIRNLEDYHNLYVQNHTSVLADVFEKFQNMSLEICELDHVHFLSASKLA